MREQWRRARHAPDLDRMARLEKAVEDADRGGALLLSFTSSLTDENVVARGEASERAARAAAGAA